MQNQFNFKQSSLAQVRSLVHFDPYKTEYGATTPGQSGPGSDGNKRVLRIPPNSSITGSSPSDCLVSY